MAENAVRKGARKTMKGAVIVLALLAVFYFAVNYLVGERGYFRYRALEDEKSRLEQEIGRLKTENEKMADEIERLKSDPEYIERLAREQGLVKEGEIIYQYEQQEDTGEGE